MLNVIFVVMAGRAGPDFVVQLIAILTYMIESDGWHFCEWWIQ